MGDLEVCWRSIVRLVALDYSLSGHQDRLRVNMHRDKLLTSISGFNVQALISIPTNKANLVCVCLL
jgi:hypothetical protein